MLKKVSHAWLSIFIVVFSQNIFAEMEEGLSDVVAPVVNGSTNVPKETGLIYFDLSDNTFKGINQNGSTDTLSTVGAGAIISDVDEQRVEHALLTTEGTGPSCSIDSQSGSWLSSTSYNGTGDCTVTITSNIFSTAPNCVATAVSGDTDRVVTLSSPTTTAFRFRRTQSATAEEGSIMIICMGTK